MRSLFVLKGINPLKEECVTPTQDLLDPGAGMKDKLPWGLSRMNKTSLGSEMPSKNNIPGSPE